jgi:hypothetical protein
MFRTLSLAFICVAFAAGDPVFAQAPNTGEPIVVAQNGPGGLFRSLFGKRRKATRGGEIRRAPEPQRQQRRNTSRRTKKRSSGSQGAVAAAPSAAEKSEDAKTVLVVGDFMANALARGLSEAFKASPDIVVVNASNGASGLVRDDYYDWGAAVPKLVAEHEANLILVMIGANDRQVIRASTGRIALNTDAWRAGYEAKVTAFSDVLSAQNVPVIWLSLVPVGSNSLSRDYSGFNSLYRQKAELKGISFADVWNGFADDKGSYVASGPDINGQNRQLRTGDGLNFTKAGRRKLAFFVERDVSRILTSDQSSIFAGLGNAGTGGPHEELQPSAPVVSAMVPLEMIDVRPGSDLSTAPARPQSDASEETGETADKKTDDKETAPQPKLAVQDAPPGRADNFSWPVSQ